MHDSEDSDTKWRVSLSRTAGKKSVKLPENVRLQINLLMREIEQLGPIRKNWPNFSALTEKGFLKMPTTAISRRVSLPMLHVGM